MPAIFRTTFAALCALLFAACSGAPVVATAVQQGDTLAMRHSRLLHIVSCDSFSVVEIKNPWRQGLLHRYLLVDRDSALPHNMPAGTLLRTPLSRSLLFSGVHIALLEELGAVGSVRGVCDARYMPLQAVERGVASGYIVDCGSSLNVDVERVVQLAPDAVFVLPFENGGYGKLEKLKYPLVECAEYMEPSPLAAAEWMRFYGRLVGCGEKVDSLFEAVCSAYTSIASIASSADEAPTLMCELKSPSAWYVPAAGSTMGQMYKAAGADYLFAAHHGSGSVPLSFETVLHKAAGARFWLFKYNSRVEKTYSSLLNEFPGYAHFAPFKERNIYACNTGRKPVFEETAFHPELLLKELVAIFHPSLFPGYKTRYYEKLQE